MQSPPLWSTGHRVDLKADLIALLEKRTYSTEQLIWYGIASDASPYRLVPQVVILLEQPMTSSSSSAIAVKPGGTRRFGPAGTSLNGQSQSDDILIDVRRHWVWRQSGG